MKKETWKTIIQVIVSILTAALTALGTTSCMGYGLIAFLICYLCRKKSKNPIGYYYLMGFFY